MGKSIDQLRQEISDLDDEILKLAAKRMGLAKEVAEYKLENNLPVKDYNVEKNIIARTRQKAKNYNIHTDLAEKLMTTLIKYSCIEQDELTVSRKSHNVQKEIFIIGGNGNMGQWLAHFFDSMGHGVWLYDRNKSNNENFPVAESIEQCKNADLILVATPLAATSQVLEDIIKIRPQGTVVEICSLKNPIIDTIAKARSSQIKIASIHPMFGPEIEILSGKNIIVCTGVNHEATQSILSILKQTTANIVSIPIEEHDNYMGYVLGITHLMNLIYGRLMSKSNLPLNKLKEVAGTTFFNQLDVTQGVIFENQDLYFDIQALNSETPIILEGLSQTLEEFTEVLHQLNRDDFKDIMEKTKNFFKNEKSVRN